MPRHFADAVVQRIRRLGHPLCVGLDPHLDRIPSLFHAGSMAPTDPRTTAAVEAFLTAILDRIADRVAIVKPQSAFFELLGWRGLRVLTSLIEHAHRAGLLVLLDAKRGDIGSTAKAYATACLGASAAIPADALTINPYLGRDSLSPFIARAQEQGCGLFVLVKTSNPGSSDFQNLTIGSGDEPLFARVAAVLADDTNELIGPATGWSSLGVVVGATFPEESARVRELLPRSLFLIPGYGAQGATAREAVRGFVPGPQGQLEGGIVNSSRGVLFPAAGASADAERWETAVDDALARSIDELGEAVSG